MIQVGNGLRPPLKHAWRQGICMGRAFEILRADGRRDLEWVQRRLRYRYCRFHGLFHDEMGVAVRRTDGGLTFQWRQMDDLLDFLLSIGLRPFLELGPMPKALASGPTTFFQWRMNVTPPRDFAEWGQLVEAFALHCVERYGLEEVRQWRFEVWNEPNLRAFWTGTQEDYWQLYAEAARALKSVDPELKVGGPASAEAGWIEPFLQMTADRGVPLDFLSTHAYPQNEFADHGSRAESPHRPGEYFSDVVRRVREQTDRFRPGLPVYWTEWSSLDAGSREDVDWYANPTIDDLSSGACAVRNAVACDASADGLFWWVASDVFEEMGLPHAPYAASFGLLNLLGIPKASAQAFWLLAQMIGPQREIRGLEDGGRGAVATSEGRCTRVLLWNHVPPGMPAEAWEDELQMPGAAGGVLSELRIAAGSGSAYEAWRDAGEPHHLTPVQTAVLEAQSSPASRLVRLAGDSVRFRLGPNEVALFEFAPAPDPKVEKGVDPETSLWADALLVDDRER